MIYIYKNKIKKQQKHPGFNEKENQNKTDIS